MLFNMPAGEKAVDNFQQLTSDNQLDDGGKTYVTHLEMFSWKSAKLRNYRYLRDVTMSQQWGGDRSMGVFIDLSVFQHPKIIKEIR